MKLDLLTNATVVDDAIRFVSDIPKKDLNPSSSYNEVAEESKQHNSNNKDDDQAEEETGEIAAIATTTNDIF